MVKSVAVVGTGLSGSSCARQLSKTFNFNVKLFDKSRGTGGRMATRRGAREDGTKFQCDHGAQYFTARSENFQIQMQEWLEAGVVGKWDAKPHVFDGSNWQISSSEIDRWCGTPVMKEPIKQLLATQNVQLNTTISDLKKTADGQWQLHSVEHGWDDAKYDAVVFAVPAPQATPLLIAHSTKLATISEHALMKGAWALMLQYEKSVDVPFDSAFINAGPLSWISRDNSKPGRNNEVETWLLHATSEWSDTNIEATSDQVATELIDAFCGLTTPSPIGRPMTWSAHRWRYATTHPNLEMDSAWDAENNLGMCGDWMSVGKIEGAWQSGFHLAGSINKAFMTD